MGDTNASSGMGTLCTIDVDAMATIRARLGFFFGEERQFMLFATGGLAAVWIDVNNPAPGGSTTNYTEATYVVGGGFEAYVFGTDWVSTKIEYLFVGLDDSRTYSIGAAAAAANATLNFDGIHAVRWGWNLHF
ncbi:MAG: hypothetical protein GY947_23040 [Rhodobacteraceae bacterium]|nr:hypothetical protein [Paracoccaceae bacterium]